MIAVYNSFFLMDFPAFRKMDIELNSFLPKAFCKLDLSNVWREIDEKYNEANPTWDNRLYHCNEWFFVMVVCSR